MIDWDAVPRITDHRQFGGREPWFNGWPFGSIAIDPRGRRILTGGARGLRLYEAATGELIRTFEGRGNIGSTYERIGFSADGREAFAHIGGALETSALGVWDVETGALSRTLDESGGGNVSALSRDGRRALARDGKAEAALWDLEAGRVLRTMKPRPEGGLSAAVFLGPGADRAVATLGGTTATLWDLESGAQLWTQSIGGAYVLAAPADGSWFAAVGSNGQVRVHDGATGTRRFVLGEPAREFENSGLSMDVSADGRRLAAVSGTHLRVWDLAARALLASLEIEKETAVAFSPDGRWIAYGGPRGTLARFSPGDPLPETTRSARPAHTKPVTRVAFGEGGDLFSAEDHGLLLRWREDGTATRVQPGDAPPRLLPSTGTDVVTQTPPAWLKDLESAIAREIARNDDLGSFGTVAGATLAATIMAGNGVQVWDLAKSPARPIQEIHIGSTPGSHVFSSTRQIALHPDGRRIAIATTRGDAPLQIWDARDGLPLAVCLGHEAEVTAVAWSADGTHLASGSADRTVRLWKIGA